MLYHNGRISRRLTLFTIRYTGLMHTFEKRFLVEWRLDRKWMEIFPVKMRGGTVVWLIRRGRKLVNVSSLAICVMRLAWRETLNYCKLSWQVNGSFLCKDIKDISACRYDVKFQTSHTTLPHTRHGSIFGMIFYLCWSSVSAYLLKSC